ncbi:MAG: BrnT family toxin [Candidatus Omnitrophica bacterium]|nr:BrnT family toxin [Candidatus Omnitrophota bacterium]
MDKTLGSFVWDEERERLNVEKHGVDFEQATRAFLDPRRKIYTDSKHSQREERLFCIGRVGQRIVTVRFVYRSGKIRIFGAGYWRKGRAYYEKKGD